jgi:hypothetical protein
VLGGAIGAEAIPVPFRLAGDGKILVQVRVSNPRAGRWSPWLTLVLDTGASKTVLFQPALDRLAPRSDQWPTLRGLTAATLMDSPVAAMVRVPRLELAAAHGKVAVDGMDAGLIESELAPALEQITGGPVHGLLGYSFLQHFRFAIDYPHRVLWLERRRDPGVVRPYEYCHVGVQLERRGDAAVIVGVADGSPAADAGVRTGDVLIAVDGARADSLDVPALSRMLEGPPGTRVEIVVQRGTTRRTLALARERLL